MYPLSINVLNEKKKPSKFLYDFFFNFTAKKTLYVVWAMFLNAVSASRQFDNI